MLNRKKLYFYITHLFGYILAYFPNFKGFIYLRIRYIYSTMFKKYE